MELRSIVFYLQIKGMKRRHVDGDLVATLHEDALAYSTVTLQLRQDRLARFSEPCHKSADDGQGKETDQAILSAFTVQLFGLMHDITLLTYLSYSTLNSHLMPSLRFRIRHFLRSRMS
jgi:hypothetical protein